MGNKGLGLQRFKIYGFGFEQGLGSSGFGWGRNCDKVSAGQVSGES